MGPQGSPGRDGMPGRDGLNGLQGERGPAGKDGRDGVDGKDGAGDTPMGKKNGAKDLATLKLSEAEIEAVINDGKGRSPAFKGKMTPEEVKETVAFVKGLQK